MTTWQVLYKQGFRNKYICVEKNEMAGVTRPMSQMRKIETVS